MSASNEVEEMSRQHFWTLAAAFSLAALVHVFYDRLVPDHEWEALGSVLAVAVIAYVCGRLREGVEESSRSGSSSAYCSARSRCHSCGSCRCALPVLDEG